MQRLHVLLPDRLPRDFSEHHKQRQACKHTHQRHCREGVCLSNFLCSQLLPALRQRHELPRCSGVCRVQLRGHEQWVAYSAPAGDCVCDRVDDHHGGSCHYLAPQAPLQQHRGPSWFPAAPRHDADITPICAAASDPDAPSSVQGDEAGGVGRRARREQEAAWLGPVEFRHRRAVEGDPGEELVHPRQERTSSCRVQARRRMVQDRAGYREGAAAKDPSEQRRDREREHAEGGIRSHHSPSICPLRTGSVGRHSG
mmetsp:Transcript_42415/g.133612  ORF Transcript_42415/g.133612 Transcript_42415/m.133612 type:complete len:255 (+) Transcript_42415:546-1310(+)